jgi:hypothetical protein
VASDRAADALADALAAVMLPVAQRSEHVTSTSPAPDVVDVVVDLGELSRYLAEHTRRVMAGEPAHGWAEVADALAAAAEACRRLVMLDLDDAGDAGGR